MKYPSDPTPAQWEAEKLRIDLTAALSSERRLREELDDALGWLEDIHARQADPVQFLANYTEPVFGAITAGRAALTTPAACPDLVLVGREEWERVQKQVTEAGLKGGGE